MPSLWRVASASTVFNLLLATEDRVAEIRQSAPDVEDDFQTNSGLWELFYEGDAAGYLRNGEYHVTIDAEDTVAWGDSELEADNFYLEVDITHVGDALESEAGVLFRYVGLDDFYFYSISKDGFYKLDMLVDNEWQTVVDATESSAIDTTEEAVNRLGILVEGEQISLLVNNQLLEEIEDATLSGVEVNLGAGSFDEIGVDVAFDNLSFWNLNGRQFPDVADTSAHIASIRAREPVFQDDFSRITNAWDLDATDDIISSYDDRELHVRIIRPNWSSYGGLDLNLSDFLFEVDTNHVDGPTLGQYGIYFRNVDGENYYYFAIDATGEYSLWKVVDNEWETIIDWTQSDVLNDGAGAENRLGVLAQGAALALLANDEVLVEIADDSLAAGAMGMFVATFDEGDLEIAFDNVDVWDLASGEPVEATPVSTPAPTPTPTPAPDLTPTPTAVPDVDSGREGSDLINEIRSANPTYRDDFNNDESWETESTDEIEVFFADDALHIRMIPEGRIGWSTTEQELADFFLEFDVAHVEGPDDAEAGVMFRRVDDLNYLLYAINPAGSYRLDRRVGGEWETLVGWTQSNVLQTGRDAINRLGVLAEGDQITLFANDSLLTEVEDDTFIKGGLALTVGTFGEGDAEAVFDNLAIWTMPITEQIDPTPTSIAGPDVDIQEDAVERVDAITATDPTHRDNFDSDEHWDIQSTEDVEYTVADGELTIRVIPDQLIGWSETDQELADFYLEVDITHVDGPPGFEAGLLFRMVDNQNYYLYVIDDVGNYRFDRRADGNWETLVDWTESSVLETGDDPINRLGILAEGDKIALFANDTLLTEVEDSIHSIGSVAAEVGTFDEGDATASFDNLTVWALSPPLPFSPTPPVAISDSGAADISERIEDIQASDPTFRENFSRDTGAWTMTSSDDASISYRRRALYILINRDNWLAWSSHERDMQDFLVETDTKRIAGPLDAGYGLVFRSVDDENQYIFRINGLGEYSLWKTVDNEWFDLFDWTQSDSIDTSDGAVNRIGVLAEGPQISLIINDSVVAQVEDESLLSGVTGLVTGAYDDPGIEVAFDNVDLWDLSQ